MCNESVYVPPTVQGVQGSKLGMYRFSFANVNKEYNPGISASVAGLVSAWPGGALAQPSPVHEPDLKSGS